MCRITRLRHATVKTCYINVWDNESLTYIKYPLQWNQKKIHIYKKIN